MSLLTYSVIRRHMKPTNGFTLCDDTAAVPLKLSLTENESMIGWYRNPAPWEDSLLIFTSNAIWIVERQESERIALRDILRYENPETKERVTGLRVRVKDGFRFFRAAGSYGPQGQYKDWNALMMVLRAVLNSSSVPE